MVNFLDYEGTDPASTAVEAAEAITAARNEVEAKGIKGFLFQASSPEEFDQRVEFSGVPEVLDEVADKYLGSPDQRAKLTAVLRREFLAGSDFGLGPKCPECPGYGDHATHGGSWPDRPGPHSSPGGPYTPPPSRCHECGASSYGTPKCVCGVPKSQLHSTKQSSDPCGGCPAGTKCVCTHDGCKCVKTAQSTPPVMVPCPFCGANLPSTELDDHIRLIHPDEVKESRVCRTCDRSVENLRDEASVKEAAISGLCQGCQDDYFGKTAAEPEEPKKQWVKWQPGVEAPAGRQCDTCGDNITYFGEGYGTCTEGTVPDRSGPGNEEEGFGWHTGCPNRGWPSGWAQDEYVPDTCPTCKGAGMGPDQKCTWCKGSGEKGVGEAARCTSCGTSKKCVGCGGTGISTWGSDEGKTCDTCGGTGDCHFCQQTKIGLQCSSCGGEGHRAYECEFCGGSGEKWRRPLPGETPPGRTPENTVKNSSKSAANQTPDDPSDPRWDDCQIVPHGKDTNGDEWNRCVTHDQLVFGDAPYCEGHREPGYKDPKTSSTEGPLPQWLEEAQVDLGVDYDQQGEVT